MLCRRPISIAVLFFFSTTVLCFFSATAVAQHVKSSDVPAAVKAALSKRFPSATGVTWEREKGDFEANWGGRSKEDNSVLFTPAGEFVEIVVAMPVNGLPAAVATYVRAHYPGAKITEAGKVTDAKGKTCYEAEVKGRDLRFDENGNYLRVD